jgi:hypothetical protein
VFVNNGFLFFSLSAPLSELAIHHAGTDGPIGGKWLEVLKETAPQVSRVMILIPKRQAFWRSFQAAVPRFGVEVKKGSIHDADEIRGNFVVRDVRKCRDRR